MSFAISGNTGSMALQGLLYNTCGRVLKKGITITVLKWKQEKRKRCDFYFVILTHRVVSSVGLEHHVDNVRVAGSRPAQPTFTINKKEGYFVVSFFFIDA